MECGVCWQVYDPQHGDATRDISPGTPFSALPADWRCPRCQAAPLQFLPHDEGRRSTPDAAPWQTRVDKLVAAYEAVAEQRMRGLPVYNERLRVEAVGFQPWGTCLIGVLITPWFMNAVLLPERDRDWAALQEGAQIGWALPSGRYTFVHGRLEGFGVLQSCSLFSPMGMFDQQAVARITAQAALEALLEAPAAADAPRSLSRRDFLLPGG